MAELAIWIASFVAAGWLSILCAYAIGMMLLLPVTGLAWVVEDMFPRVIEPSWLDVDPDGG